MAQIKSKGNKSTELALIKIFKTNNIKGWKRNYPVIGKPDFIFLKKRIAIFADGCFWHGHNCRNVNPKENNDYWSAKIESNKERDKTINIIFQKRGWFVIRYWECEIYKKQIDLSLLF